MFNAWMSSVFFISPSKSWILFRYLILCFPFFLCCHVDSLTSHWLLPDDGADETGEIGGTRGRGDRGRDAGHGTWLGAGADFRLNGEYFIQKYLITSPRSQKGVDCELVGNLALSHRGYISIYLQMKELSETLSTMRSRFTHRRPGLGFENWVININFK